MTGVPPSARTTPSKVGVGPHLHALQRAVGGEPLLSARNECRVGVQRQNAEAISPAVVFVGLLHEPAAIRRFDVALEGVEHVADAGLRLMIAPGVVNRMSNTPAETG